jgi:hydroxypyruvate reductase
VNAEIDLRRAAREIFDAGLASVDAGKAVSRAVSFDGQRLVVKETSLDLDPSRSIYALAVGKAAVPMAAALDEALGDRINAGIVVGPRADFDSGKPFSLSTNFDKRWKVCKSAHPLPTDSSLAAAQSAFELLRRANNERALVIFLISGGGSSMIEWPLDKQITLSDVREANRILVSCGASITEINSVRRGFSGVKGGRLASRAPSADQITLIVSDTAKGQESIVSSGPTFDPPKDAPDALDVIGRYRLHGRLPASILKVVKSPVDSVLPDVHKRLRQHFVLLDCETAIDASTSFARSLGFAAESRLDISEQLIVDGCQLMLSRLVDLRSQASNVKGVTCLISGGEFSCPVRGDGIGGRNADTGLRCAIILDEMRRGMNAGFGEQQFTILSAGTDGIDGNSPAAGAIATEETVERARKLGLDPVDFLERSDAYSFFNALGDAIMTGPTGTNVRDLRVTLTTLECADLSALFSSRY